MKITLRGVEWKTGFFYWYDPAEVMRWRYFGIDRMKLGDFHTTWICLWYFNIGWGKKK